MCHSSKADSSSKDAAASDASTAAPAAAGAELEVSSAEAQHAAGHGAWAEDAGSDDELHIRHAADSRDVDEWQQGADADEEGDEGSEDEDGLDAAAVMTDADTKMEVRGSG